MSVDFERMFEIAVRMMLNMMMAQAISTNLLCKREWELDD